MDIKNKFIAELKQEFEKNRNDTISKEQSGYMKNLFPFLGLKKPIRSEAEKKVINKYKDLDENLLHEIILSLYEMEFREYQYTACELAFVHKNLLSEKSLSIFEKMIRNKSWWDTVDSIATKLMGYLLQKYDHLQKNMDKWILDPNLWIKRSAILFQLKYKDKTDEKKLFDYCKKTMNEKEFFIRKAIGWALREYSKTDNSSVRDFVDKNRSFLSNLSIKEASKYLI